MNLEWKTQKTEGVRDTSKQVAISIENQENKQRKFEDLTQAGFEKLKEVIGDAKHSVDNKFMENLVLEAGELGIMMFDYVEPDEALFLIPTLFGRFKEMRDFSKLRSEQRGRNEKETPSYKLLQDLELNILEFAGRHGCDENSQWPLRNVWINCGAKNVYMTDIDPDYEYDSREEYDKDQFLDFHMRKLDVLEPTNFIAKESFDFIFSSGFFGQPSIDIAEETNRTPKEIEHTVINNLKNNLRPGGFFIFGTREEFSLDLNILKDEGFEIIECKLFNDYLVMRKKGISLSPK